MIGLTSTVLPSPISPSTVSTQSPFTPVTPPEKNTSFDVKIEAVQEEERIPGVFPNDSEIFVRGKESDSSDC